MKIEMEVYASDRSTITENKQAKSFPGYFV